MKDKNKQNKKIIIGVIIVGLVLIIGGLIYDHNNDFEKWIVCDYKGEYTVLKETLKFRYVYDAMYGYYENREVTTPDEETKQELLKQANDFGKDFHQDEKLSYKVEEDGLVVKTSFYIKTLEYQDFIKQYFDEMDLNIQSSKEEVIEKLGNNYDCKIV